jgi:hypothetical protein
MAVKTAYVAEAAYDSTSIAGFPKRNFLLSRGVAH